MRHRPLVDKTIDPSARDPKAALEDELHAVGDRLLVAKKMTLGYAIHILSMVDQDSVEAEKVHSRAVVEAIEEFRGRIAELAEGKVKPPKKGSVQRPEDQFVAPPVTAPPRTVPEPPKQEKPKSSRPLPRIPAMPRVPAVSPAAPKKAVTVPTHAPASPAAPRTEADRHRDFVTSTALRFTGSVKEGWTFEHAVDFLCDHFAQMPRRVIFKVFGPERFPQDQYYELLRIGAEALRTAATLFDPMRDGDVSQFLEGAIRTAYR